MTAQAEAKGLIGWFAANHVAANLMMIFIIAAGLYTVLSIKKESFPPFNFDMITVSVPYPGAGPEEVEEGSPGRCRNGEEASEEGGETGQERVTVEKSEQDGNNHRAAEREHEKLRG